MYYIDRFYNFFMWIHLYVDVHVVISRAYERGGSAGTSVRGLESHEEGCQSLKGPV